MSGEDEMKTEATESGSTGEVQQKVEPEPEEEQEQEQQQPEAAEASGEPQPESELLPEQPPEAEGEKGDAAASGQAAQSTPNASRYPYPPEGYYPGGYPPPPGDGSAPPYPPPGRGYEGAPYGVPPPHMGGYPMYPYHQPPMYPHYPGYPPPPMYGYPPPGEGYPGRDEGAGAGPYNSAAQSGVDAEAGHGNGEEKSKDEPKSGNLDVHSGMAPPALGSAARLKTYIKPRMPSSQDVLDRRSRKNAQSRSRAAKLRDRIAIIETKSDHDRTEEEKQIFAQFEARRQRKNDRSRERALEKKEEIDRILAKPEKKRTKIEKQFLEGALGAKKRKNEGDRLRRQRLKELGLSSKTTGLKPGISARGPIPPYRGMPPPHGYGPNMGEIPMSPMPPMGGHHPGMQSPGGFGAASPGGMHHMGFPSPQHSRRPEAGAPGVLETPGRSGPGQGGSHLPYIPPTQAYDSRGGSSPGGGQQGGDQQYPQHGGSSRVEQRRHPDGSMSISIGGGEAGGSSFVGEAGMPDSNEISDLLIYNDGEGQGDAASGGD